MTSAITAYTTGHARAGANLMPVIAEDLASFLFRLSFQLRLSFN